MKSINNYIQEKLYHQEIDEKLIVNNTIQGYNYYPKDKYELRKILENRLAKDKNANLNDIDISKIIDMGYKDFPNDTGLFENLDPHNIDISYWDVHNVKDMSGMFFECKNIKCDISKWDVSNVKNMQNMFDGSKFNGDISRWNTSSVENMYSMFAISDFDGDIHNWDVRNVKTMEGMFSNSSFNGDINSWKVNADTKMLWMFDGCPLENNPPKWYKIWLNKQ